MDSRGFSLIELLVVIAIIAILASTATVAYMSYIAKSRYSKMRSLLEEMKAAEETYYADNDVYLNGTCSAFGKKGIYSCEVGGTRIEVPGGFCVKFSPGNCAEGVSGYRVVIAYEGLRNSQGTGPAVLVYNYCQNQGGEVICQDSEMHGQSGNCEDTECP